MSIPLYQTSQAAYRGGLCVVPPTEDGFKHPLTEMATIDGETKATWKHWAIERPSKEKMRRWYGDGSDPTDSTLRTGIGYLGGAISGGLTLFETDEAGLYDRLKEAAIACGLGPLLQRIEDGYLEVSPGGGKRVLYRCPQGIMGSTKLAMRPRTAVEIEASGDDKKYQVLIETRGEGGYMICAPSNGRVHPSGGKYRLLKGSVSSIVTITPEEQADLWELARAFDEMPDTHTDEGSHTTGSTAKAEGDRPGDDFNKRATWEETGLYDGGWQRAYARGGITYLRRPGKRVGISASLDYKGAGYLYVFSTSTDFEAERGYSKFAVYTILNHNGDFKTATKELAARGYGKHGNDSAALKREVPAESIFEGPPADDDGFYRDCAEDEPIHSARTTGASAETKRDIFVTAREVAEATPEHPTFVVTPWIAEGGVTEVDGAIKGGKTTWVVAMCRAVLDGLDFMGYPTMQGPVIYLSEQPSSSFREALRRADLLEREDFHILFWSAAQNLTWTQKVGIAVQKALDVGARLLIVDTLAWWAGMRGEAENNAGAAQEAMEPLCAAAGSHPVGIVVLRHERKGGGEVGQSARGSSAFGGSVDVVLQLRRPEGNPGASPTMRVLHSLSRFDETPPELMIELTPDGTYIAHGDVHAVAVTVARQAVTVTLKVGKRNEDGQITYALTEAELLAECKEQGVKRSTLQDALTDLCRAFQVRKTGAGKKGDPYRYEWIGA